MTALTRAAKNTETAGGTPRRSKRGERPPRGPREAGCGHSVFFPPLRTFSVFMMTSGGDILRSQRAPPPSAISRCTKVTPRSTGTCQRWDTERPCCRLRQQEHSTGAGRGGMPLLQHPRPQGPLRTPAGLSPDAERERLSPALSLGRPALCGGPIAHPHQKPLRERDTATISHSRVRLRRQPGAWHQAGAGWDGLKLIIRAFVSQVRVKFKVPSQPSCPQRRRRMGSGDVATRHAQETG